jgi:hypothetical protein
MKNEPATSEEYVRLVEQQAREQEKEEVASHRDILNNFESAQKDLKDKQRFYTFLLLVVALSYLAIRLFPEKLGFTPNEEI